MLKLPIKLHFQRSAFNKLYQGIIKLIPLFIEGAMPGKTEGHQYGVPDHPVLYLCQLEWNNLVMDAMDDHGGYPDGLQIGEKDFVNPGPGNGRCCPACRLQTYLEEPIRESL